jgi:hypothetical protein
MTERLVEDAAAVRVLAQLVADQTSIPVAHVEKDFWVTEVLRGAVAAATDSGLDVVLRARPWQETALQRALIGTLLTR